MRKDSLRPALAAGLCVAAIGFGAATLSNAVVVSSRPDFSAGSHPIDLPGTATTAYVALALALVLAAVGIYYFGSTGIANKHRIVKAVPILLGIVLLIVLVNHTLFTALQPDQGFDMSGANGHGEGDDGAEQNNSSDDGGGPIEPEADGNFYATGALLGILLVGLIAVLGAEYIPDRGDDGPTRGEVARAAEDDEAIADAAGRAADRIETADEGAENEVYRAWKEMAESVDVADPRTATPADFAAAAADAGLDPDRVDELTDLFEAVRYGDREVTEERERRAIEALREIEREHGGDDR